MPAVHFEVGPIVSPMSMALSIWDAFLYGSGLLLAFSLYNRYAKKSGLPLPPGPPKWPVLGHYLDFPSSAEWESFHSWSKEYKSDIIHLNVFGVSIVILNSVKTISDLMEKRSSIYSGRPKFTLINKYMGFGWLLPFVPFGAALKERRRVFQRYFQSKTFKETLQSQTSLHVHRLLLQLLDSPDSYMEHIKHFVGGILHSVTYGTDKQSNVHYVNLAEDVTDALSGSAIPISGLIDVIPWALPILAPIWRGLPFNKTPAEWKDLVYQSRDEPFLKTKKMIAEGNAEDSFVSWSLENMDRSSKSDIAEQELAIKDIAGVVFVGGSSTSKAVLYSFFLAMMCFPDAQRKAQEELDRVIGRERLPEPQDEPFLPYISAIVKEVQRWHPPGPMGIPHFLEQDDEYNGYRIPGQSLIIGNAWALLNDEWEYPDPRNFLPERFLKDGKPDPSVRDPADFGFGFGRRVCPGAHIALATIWLSVASILSTFTISKDVDENGEIIEPTMEYQAGVTHQPVPFKCTIKARHDRTGSLI
ncbi:hypothetical protein HYPSUDRAFT_1036249 [Hypholoma sublateritium FD-334 SS-4]|uniref:Cytochrome P450 n=1 Tax=Hypholoma sublateritium (strain FD-334 SS-4) TaxID=945553 RepID=A0A0D2P7H3_HYPSF|nr:hypothetical protein HYPSUDRAFT_1036249 [Hypholoma sublateritium FD-334 SS-4]